MFQAIGEFIRSLRFQKIFFILISIALGSVVAYRAYHLSFTHDESATYLYFKNSSVWEQLINEGIWQSANNHILNTLLYQLSVALFGQSDFTMRLPNVLAYWSALVLTYYFIFKYVKSSWTRIALVSILFINPFLIDFFSLCRGYGLGIVFNFASLVFFHIYFIEKKKKQLVLAFFFLLLATLSLLSNLILLPVYTLALWIVYRKELKKTLELIYVPIFFTTLTFIIVYRPLYFLSQNAELKFGVQSISESFMGIVGGTIRYSKYLGENTFDIFMSLFILALLIALHFALSKKKILFYAISFITLIISLHLTLYILEFYLPSNRKSTLYVPTLAFIFSLLFSDIKIPKLVQIVSSALVIFCIINFFVVLNFKDTIEWYYDGGTKKRVHTVAKSSKDTIVLQTHWLFHPTSSYYVQTKKWQHIKILPYTKEFDLSQMPDAVIGFKEDMLNYPNYQSTEPGESIALYYKKR